MEHLPPTTLTDEPAGPDGAGGLVRLRLDLAYEGTEFSGWAAQPGRRTVQGVLEAALRQVLRSDAPLRTTVAGRTDAGVHARGQVCHVDVPYDMWLAVAGRSVQPPYVAWVRRLAGVLPPDVRVRSAVEAPAGFDARFSATARRYVYRVADTAAGPDPLERRFTLWHDRRVDLLRMNEAAAGLLGEHDFAAYCRRREGATTVRTLRQLHWSRCGDGAVEAAVVADAFCHNMVRSLVGALLWVGDGRRPPEWPALVLSAAVRDPAVNVAPPHGLTLVGVDYPPNDELALRAGVARKTRERPRAT